MNTLWRYPLRIWDCKAIEFFLSDRYLYRRKSYSTFHQLCANRKDWWLESPAASTKTWFFKVWLLGLGFCWGSPGCGGKNLILELLRERNYTGNDLWSQIRTTDVVKRTACERLWHHPAPYWCLSFFMFPHASMSQLLVQRCAKCIFVCTFPSQCKIRHVLAQCHFCNAFLVNAMFTKQISKNQSNFCCFGKVSANWPANFYLWSILWQSICAMTLNQNFSTRKVWSDVFNVDNTECKVSAKVLCEWVCYFGVIDGLLI